MRLTARLILCYTTFISMDEESLIIQQQTQRHLQQYVALFLSIILSATTALLESYTTREPYHTSILTGEGWVMQLLAGHPECICCELVLRRQWQTYTYTHTSLHMWLRTTYITCILGCLPQLLRHKHWGYIVSIKYCLHVMNSPHCIVPV